MRFGLSDLDELPSLKEFEALAREALGTDEGIAVSADSSDEAQLNSPTADTLENLPPPDSSAEVFAATHGSASIGKPSVSELIQSEVLADAKTDPFLRQEEVTATAEGMPSGQLDEAPPRADSAKAGE